MNKLWLSAITAGCLLAGSAAQAGDHGRHGGWHDRYDDRREYRHCDDDDRGYHRGWHGYRRPVVYVQQPVVYSRPVYYERPDYYERPVYYGGGYGSGYGYGDGQIHGSVTVGF